MSEPARERVGSDRRARRRARGALRRPGHSPRHWRSRRSARSPAWRSGERSEPASRARAWALCAAGRCPLSKRGGLDPEPDWSSLLRTLPQERCQRAAAQPAVRRWWGGVRAGARSAPARRRGPASAASAKRSRARLAHVRSSDRMWATPARGRGRAWREPRPAPRPGTLADRLPERAELAGRRTALASRPAAARCCSV